MQSSDDIDQADSDSKSNLAKSQANSKRGMAIALPAQACRLVLHFSSICVLSRLLTPEDFGVAGMVLTVTGFLELFRDGGLGVALIQAKELPPGFAPTLFWIITAISGLLSIVMLCSGPTLAWTYREPRVIALAPILAVVIISNGLAVLPLSMMRRQLMFGKIAVVEITSALVGVGVAILAAVNGLGYYALAIQPLAISLTGLMLSWSFSPIRPGLPRWTPEIRQAMHFGGHLTGFSFVNYWARNFDQMLIGRTWGAAELGLYVRAYTLLTAPLNLINNPLSNVFVPLLSRLESRPDLFRIQYLRGLAMATSISLPVSAVLLVAAEEVVRILLGPKWPEVGIIFRLLCISAPVQFVCNSTGWLFQAMGRTDRQFRWGCFASPLIVVSFFIGIPWGSKGVALSYSCMMLPVGVLCVWYATRRTQITMWDIGRCCAPGALYAIALSAILCILKFTCADLPRSVMLDLSILAIGGIGVTVSLLSELRSRSPMEPIPSKNSNLENSNLAEAVPSA